MQDSSDFTERPKDTPPGQSETETDSSGADAVRSAELEMMFDSFLPDATEGEKAQIATLQAALHSQQKRLAGLLADEVIDVLEHARAINQEINWCFRRIN